MPVARYQLPDGRIARFEVPEGTTTEQAQQIGADYFAQQAPEPVADPQQPDAAPAAQQRQGAVNPFAAMYGGSMEAPGIPQNVRDLPEIQNSGLLAGESDAKLAALAPVLLTTTDKNEIAKIIQSNFPNVGVSYNKDNSGNVYPILVNNETGAATAINKPGMSGLDVMQAIGIGAAFTPAGRAGTVLGAGGKAALTEAAIQGGQAAVGGDFDAEQIPLAAIGGAAGRKLENAMVPPTRQAVDPGELVTEAAAASKATDIPLFKAQQTLDRPALERQSFVAQLPAGVQKASKELAAQNKAASTAVDDFLTRIAPDDSIIKAPGKFRSASQRAIQKRINARNEAADPLYTKAFNEAREASTFVDVDDLVDQTKAVAEGFPSGGEVSRSFKKINKWLEDAATKRSRFDYTGMTGKVPVKSQNLSALHNAKLEIDQMLSRNFDGSLGNTTKMKLAQIKSDLLKRMDEASPAYKVARDRFHEMSPDVTAIEESIIGKVANMSDTQLKSVSRSIFDPQNANIKNVLDAKKIIREVDPDAWNMLARAEIERRMGSIKPELGGAIENIPGKLSNAIFGTGKQRDVLFAGFEGPALENLKHLDVALRRAGLGRNLGSQTASRTEIVKELGGGLSQTIRDLFRQPISKAAEFGEGAVFDRRVKAMSEMLFDPKWAPETSKLIKAKNSTGLNRLLLSIEALNLSENGIPDQLQQQPQEAQLPQAGI